MNFKKASECDFCGAIQLTNSKGTFKSWLKRIGWIIEKIEKIEHTFCSKECLENYKGEML